MRSCRGQSSVEYVGLLALVVVVLSGTAALFATGLGGRVLYTIRLGLCTVTHAPCPPPRTVAELSPCPETRETTGQDLGVDVAIVALGGGLSVLREEYSDGHVELTFVDDGHGGVTAGVGAGFSLGGAGAEAGASLDASVGWTKGRTWRFRSRRGADAFLARYGSDQQLLGRALNDARRLCWLLCDAVGLGVDEPTAPDERYDEMGGSAAITGTLAFLAKAEASTAAHDALGWRRERGGGGSLYLELGREAAAELMALGAGASATARSAGTIELAYDAHHRPVTLRLTSAGVAHVGGSLPGLTAPAPGGAADSARLLEVGAELDLRGRHGPRIVSRLLHALRPDRLVGSPGELSSLLRWVRARAILTARAYRTTDQAGQVGGRIAIGAKLGASLGHSHSTEALEGEWTRLPGLPWLPRGDCHPT